MNIYLNIGSNTGNRLENINKAIAFLINSALMENNTYVLSDVIESAPWGFESENLFLNIGMRIVLERKISPLKILELTQSIERQWGAGNVHRDTDGNYTDRPMDIDIIAVDDVVLDSQCLTLPHPRMHLREFVLAPMNQISPDWVHPIFKVTAKELLDRLNNGNDIR